MNLSPVCETCRRPKATHNCGLCNASICKSCAEFTGDAFSFLPKVPEELTRGVYCNRCFDEKVAEPLAEYDALMEQARNVMVFRKDESKKTGHLKRKEDPIKVEDCEDEDEVLMRIAFLAAKEGFNCILDLSIQNKKIVVGSHKKTIFTATAIPITIDPSEVRSY